MAYMIGDQVELRDGRTGFVIDVEGAANPTARGGHSVTVQFVGGPHLKVGNADVSHRLADPKFEPGATVRYGGSLAEVQHQVGREVRLKGANQFCTVPLHEVVLENGGTEPAA